jgi:DNA-binding beta-propeller fold protein YncE
VAPSQASPSVEGSVAPTGPPSVPLEERLEATIPIAGADFPIIAFDSVWVVAGDPPHPAIVRVDPVTNEVVADIEVPGVACTGATAGFDAIWACSTDGIVRIDPATNLVVTVIEVKTAGQARLATGGGSVWAFARVGDSLDTNAVYRIDPATNSVITTIDLGHPVATMAFGFDALWVSSPADGLLLRVDPASNQVTIAVEGLAAPFQVTVGPDSLWVSLYGAEDSDPAEGEPTFVRIDPGTGEITASIVADPIGLTGGIHADATAVWIRGGGTFLTHIDPATNEVVEVITASKGGGDLVVGFGSVWAAGYNFHQLWRVSP